MATFVSTGVQKKTSATFKCRRAFSSTSISRRSKRLEAEAGAHTAGVLTCRLHEAAGAVTLMHSAASSLPPAFPPSLPSSLIPQRASGRGMMEGGEGGGCTLQSREGRRTKYVEQTRNERMRMGM